MCREQCRQSREARDSQTHKTLTPRISQPPISITTNNTNLEWNFIRWVLRLANICVTGIYSTSLPLQNFVVSWRKNTRNNNLLIFWNTLDFTFLSPLLMRNGSTDYRDYNGTNEHQHFIEFKYYFIFFIIKSSCFFHYNEPCNSIFKFVLHNFDDNNKLFTHFKWYVCELRFVLQEIQ